MRKGFTLVELLVVVLVLPAAALVLDRFFTTLMRDIPRSTRVIQENTTLLNMLNQMCADVGQAKRLPESYGGRASNDRMLLIETTDGVICYRLDEGRARRYKVTDAQGQDGDEARVWSLPNSEIVWQVWKKAGAGYAVEVKTHIKQKLRKGLQKKMINSHLYFVGAFQGGRAR
ncbi:MAG: prepilin-type N-terminal cleavage/methylation domain-containing protein [Phycisphaerales bacterium]|nr:MAG: prepilin-type N-terminal cleavage/methylation domain-containing protein [Phycisphaerales bacterium]